MLKPGTYKLTRTIENPHADRRQKHDWRARPTWERDTEFLVVEHKRDLDALDNIELTPEQRATIEERSRYTTIRLVNWRWSHMEIGPGHEEQYDALAAWLMPIDESSDSMFTRLGVHDYFSFWLVESGRLTPQLFEKLWNEYQNDAETPDEDETKPRPQLVERNRNAEIVTGGRFGVITHHIENALERSRDLGVLLEEIKRVSKMEGK